MTEYVCMGCTLSKGHGEYSKRAMHGNKSKILCKDYNTVLRARLREENIHRRELMAAQPAPVRGEMETGPQPEPAPDLRKFR